MPQNYKFQKLQAHMLVVASDEVEDKCLAVGTQLSLRRCVQQAYTGVEFGNVRQDTKAPAPRLTCGKDDGRSLKGHRESLDSEDETDMGKDDN